MVAIHLDIHTDFILYFLFHLLAVPTSNTEHFYCRGRGLLYKIDIQISIEL